jgi:hypothetical protein
MFLSLRLLVVAGLLAVVYTEESHTLIQSKEESACEKKLWEYKRHTTSYDIRLPRLGCLPLISGLGSTNGSCSVSGFCLSALGPYVSLFRFMPE